jgi:hypothetical protein
MLARKSMDQKSLSRQPVDKTRNYDRPKVIGKLLIDSAFPTV